VEPTIVIGCGRRLSGDDALGLAVAEELAKLPHPNFEVFTIEQGSTPEFLHSVSASNLLVVIDSVESSAAPGTFHCVKLPSAVAKPRHFSMPTRAAALSSPKIFLIGIAIAETTPGQGLSPKVRLAVDQLVKDFARYRKLAEDLTSDRGSDTELN
jgi:hydrogenase maturation protease